MATSNAATTFLENKLLNFLFKNNAGSFSSPGDNIFVGLATAVASGSETTVTEANFGNYARQQKAASTWTVPSASTDAQIATTTQIEYPASSGTNNTITHVFIASAVSGGDIYFIGALDASKTIATGDIFRINAGNLSIQLN
tara:strand:+ start:123 stop:548 length:426 start_codon:yes stop_codon:yes gene_type:complete